MTAVVLDAVAQAAVWVVIFALIVAAAAATARWANK